MLDSLAWSIWASCLKPYFAHKYTWWILAVFFFFFFFRCWLGNGSWNQGHSWYHYKRGYLGRERLTEPPGKPWWECHMHFSGMPMLTQITVTPGGQKPCLWDSFILCLWHSVGHIEGNSKIHSDLISLHFSFTRILSSILAVLKISMILLFQLIWRWWLRPVDIPKCSSTENLNWLH